ncbi:MAG: ATP-binding protein [Verrucomicrobia bacterium]|nr:ATP-binding protein [Verrucomicrobiota bacterium]
MLRPKFLKEIELQFRVHPVCALLGPRQVGKTTLARMYAQDREVAYFDLENPLDLARLENPMLTLSKFSKQLVIIDEIQRLSDLFPFIRVLVDADPSRKFLILGSASRDLIQQSSETLAGRIGYIELMPFSLSEVKEQTSLWLRGGFPKAFLASNIEESYLWRQAYISTFLERDIPNLGFQIPPQQMRRFWLMLAHYHGQIFNASELGRSLGVSGHTIRKYLDILAGTFMVRILLPWFENLGKRQIKSPKIYFRDSGILHALLGIRTESDLDHYPSLGAFWEGFALEETIRRYDAESCYFWASQSGAELDLLLLHHGKRLGFEFKFTERPKVTPSMRISLQDLKLDHLYVVIPGDQTFPLTDQITVQGLGYPL